MLVVYFLPKSYMMSLEHLEVSESKEALKGKEFALTEVCQRDINCDKLT